MVRVETEFKFPGASLTPVRLDGEGFLHAGVVLVLGLYSDGVGRGVGFVIESRSGLEGAVGFQRKERVAGVG